MWRNPAKELRNEKGFVGYLHVKRGQSVLGAGDDAIIGHGGKLRSPR
jgi:hypothetical protein